MLSAQVTGIGAEPEVAGTILGLKEGERSNPIKGIGGVYVVWSEGQVQTGEPNEFSSETLANDLRQGVMQSAGDGVKNALQEKANIVDKRYNFF